MATSTDQELDALEQARSQWSAKDSMVANEENELATIRVRTMYGRVEELSISRGSTDGLTRLLYLTNMQAQLFKAETVPKMLQAFEVSHASMVINLMDSGEYPSYYQAMYGAKKENEPVPDMLNYGAGFVSREEAVEARRRLSNFFKEVLLPLAAETHAIIIVSALNRDVLALTLFETLPLFAASHGGKLPLHFTAFKVLAVGA